MDTFKNLRTQIETVVIQHSRNNFPTSGDSFVKLPTKNRINSFNMDENKKLRYTFRHFRYSVRASDF